MVFLLHDLVQPEQMLIKLLYLTFGLTIIGLGTAIYLHANFAPIPVDRLMLIIQDLTGMIILFSKTLIYLVLVITFIQWNNWYRDSINRLFRRAFSQLLFPLTSSLLNTPIPSANRDKDKNHSI